MVTVIKRNGDHVSFDKEKIVQAISKAFLEIDGQLYETDTIIDIANDIERLYQNEELVSIEQIQDKVEEYLMRSERPDIARAYIQYRYKRQLSRAMNQDLQNRYNHIKELINGEDEETNKENSNKDTRIIPTMRDYIAGFTCRELAEKVILPKHLSEAHKNGIIHIHDTDYSPAMPMSNCFARQTKFVTDKGIKSFEDFDENDEIQVLTPSGNFRRATVKKYGVQNLNKIIFKKGNSKPVEIFATENHRWILKNKEVTTSLKIGDQLCGIKIPQEHTIQELIKMPKEKSIFWCKGFLYGDGTKWSSDGSKIRLCGRKIAFKNIFLQNGFHVSSVINGDILLANAFFAKNAPLESWSPEQIALFIEGWLAADGSYRNKVLSAKSIITIGKEEDIKIFEKYSCVGDYHIIGEDELTGQVTNYGTRKTTKTFRLYTSDYFKWKVQQIQKNICAQEVWCLEVEDEHAFVLEHGIPTGNCCLINLEDMLQNGTVISGAGIHTPHSFRTACTLATQIITQVASSQYGGSTITLAHLAPFVDISRKIMHKRHPDFTERQIESLVREEIRDGVQTIQYQLITMSTTNGQAPFVSIFMWPDEVPKGQTRDDLVLIIEEVLRQRIAGIPNEQGHPITIAFPKLLYCLDEDNCTEGSIYWWLTELAAECSAKRLVPDYISAKVMRELKGDVYPCMGKRKLIAHVKSF